MRDEFTVHILSPRDIERAKALGEVFSRCLNEIETLVAFPTKPKKKVPPPVVGERELALVRTKLQEASFFAKRALALRASAKQ